MYSKFGLGAGRTPSLDYLLPTASVPSLTHVEAMMAMHEQMA